MRRARVLLPLWVVVSACACESISPTAADAVGDRSITPTVDAATADADVVDAGPDGGNRACEPGQSRCVGGTQIAECGDDGNWQPASRSCPRGTCVEADGEAGCDFSCLAGSRECQGRIVIECDDKGDSYRRVGECSFNCEDGQCIEGCTGADDDGDGQVDEGFALGEACAVGEGACRREGQLRCRPPGTEVECSAIEGAPSQEICNSIDDDCDGLTDEAFDLLDDRENCGACGIVCEAPQAIMFCNEGECDFVRCEEEWEDCNSNIELDGCEARGHCGDVDECNGLDDDRDGRTDEGFVAEACGQGACRAVSECLNGQVVPCRAGQAAAADVLCDGIDEDCDGVNDEDYRPVPCGVGACAAASRCEAGVAIACAPAEGGPEICNDADDDCDGAIDEGIDLLNDRENCGACGVSCELPNAVSFCNQGVCEFVRCDDDWANCNGAVEPDGCETAGECGLDQCDGQDDDVDGRTDEDFMPTPCGVGACAAQSRCEEGEEIVCTPGIPGADDATCDGQDDDCDGESDEDYVAEACGQGLCAALSTCRDGVESRCQAGPQGPAEVCDGLDSDCDGRVDERPNGPNPGMPCQEGVGACSVAGSVVCGANASWRCSAVPGLPAADDARCDGVDDDCDARIDEDFAGATCGVGGCERPEVCVEGRVTCEPGDPAAADGICDGVDDDCDGRVDEAFVGEICGQGRCQSQAVCLAGVPSACMPAEPGPEDCNLVDDDCDGEVDEACCGAVREPAFPVVAEPGIRLEGVRIVPIEDGAMLVFRAARYGALDPQGRPEEQRLVALRIDRDGSAAGPAQAIDGWRRSEVGAASVAHWDGRVHVSFVRDAERLELRQLNELGERTWTDRVDADFGRPIADELQRDLAVVAGHRIATWRDANQVTIESGGGFMNISERLPGNPALAADGTGKPQFLVAFESTGGLETRLIGVRKLEVLGEAIILPDEQGEIGARDPFIVPAGPGYGVVWSQSDGRDLQVHFARLDGQGRRVGQPRQVTASADDSALPTLAWTGAHFVVGWREGPSNNGRPHFARLSPVGEIFDGPRELTVASIQGPRESVTSARLDGRTLLTWHDRSDEQSRIGLVVLRDDCNLEPDHCAEPAGEDSSCDAVDDDCDGRLDEDFVGAPCSTGLCDGRLECRGGQIGCSASVPTYERCDGADNDCDGRTDEANDPDAPPRSIRLGRASDQPFLLPGLDGVTTILWVEGLVTVGPEGGLRAAPVAPELGFQHQVRGFAATGGRSAILTRSGGFAFFREIDLMTGELGPAINLGSEEDRMALEVSPDGYLALLNDDWSTVGLRYLSEEGDSLRAIQFGDADRPVGDYRMRHSSLSRLRDGHVAVSHRDFSHNPGDGLIVAFLPDDQNERIEQQVLEVGAHATPAVAAAADGGYAVLWRQTAASLGIRAYDSAHEPDDIQIVDIEESIFQPSAVWLGSSFAVAWRELRPEAYSLVLARMRDDGSEIGPRLSLSQGPSILSYQMASSGNGVTVTYRANSSAWWNHFVLECPSPLLQCSQGIDGVPCDDGDPATEGDVCVDGACGEGVGIPIP